MNYGSGYGNIINFIGRLNEDFLDFTFCCLLYFSRLNFDGLGDSLPTGLKDVSDFPNVIYQLLKRGYSEEDIKKICSGNLLRVWERVEEVALKRQKVKG